MIDVIGTLNIIPRIIPIKAPKNMYLEDLKFKSRTPFS